MLHLVAAIVFLVLGSMVVLMLAAGHLPRNFAAGAALLAPLIGVAAAFWAWIGSVAHEAAPRRLAE
jgi:hypothetical protein